MSERPLVFRIFRGAFRWLDRLRRGLHLVLLLITIAVLIVAVSPEPVLVPARGALVLNPQGAIVEQLSGGAFERALARAQGLPLDQSLLSDMVDAIRAARDDSRITALVLRLDGMGAAGLSALQDLALEIDAFRASGKPVHAIGAAFDRNQYYLAARADEVSLHPMGVVLVEGYEATIPYFREAIEKLSIDYRVWAAGEFKSAVEPITRDDMSPADRAARSLYLGGMWGHYQRDVTAARGLNGDAMQRYADEFANLLRQNAGDSAALALDYGLVDRVESFDLADDRIRAIAGDAPAPAAYSAIDYASYITALRAEDFSIPAPEKIGIIVASGEILDGEQPAGTVGAASLIRLIRAAREDDAIKGLVLRVDSPGGSAFASELIRRELELFSETGRPVIASMGSVAASGGYWISMSADEIWAGEATLTGSIGAFAAVATFPRALARLGVNLDTVGTTRLSGQSSPLAGIGEDIDQYVDLSLQQLYTSFVSQVAAHRNLDPADAEASAQGRVWLGSDALERGLVDRLGTLDDAITAAAEFAELERDSYSIEYLEPVPGLAERIAMELVRVSAPLLQAVGEFNAIPAPLRRVAGELAGLEPWLTLGSDPRGIYTHCLCDAR